MSGRQTDRWLLLVAFTPGLPLGLLSCAQMPTLDLPPWPPPTVYLTTSCPGTEATSLTCDGEKATFPLLLLILLCDYPHSAWHRAYLGGSRHDFLLGKDCVVSPALWSALLDSPHTWRFQSRGPVS